MIGCFLTGKNIAEKAKGAKTCATSCIRLVLALIAHDDPADTADPHLVPHFNVFWLCPLHKEQSTARCDGNCNAEMGIRPLAYLQLVLNARVLHALLQHCRLTLLPSRPSCMPDAIGQSIATFVFPKYFCQHGSAGLHQTHALSEILAGYWMN